MALGLLRRSERDYLQHRSSRKNTGAGAVLKENVACSGGMGPRTPSYIVPPSVGWEGHPTHDISRLIRRDHGPSLPQQRHGKARTSSTERGCANRGMVLQTRTKHPDSPQ